MADRVMVFIDYQNAYRAARDVLASTTEQADYTFGQFDYAHEMTVRKNEDSQWCEADLWAVADGQLVLGEATIRKRPR